MKIDPQIINSMIQPGPSAPIGASPGNKFREIFESLRKQMQLQGNSLDSGFNNLHRVRDLLGNSRGFDPKLLLQYQVAASELHLKVEFLSKVSESAMAFSRKIQSQQ